MTNYIEIAKNQIIKATNDAYNSLLQKGEFPCEMPCTVCVETPKDKSNGDFAINTCMQGAKALKQPPRVIAEKLVGAMDFSGTYIRSATIAGPGFVNFYLSPDFYYDCVKTIINEGENYGRTNFGGGKKVMVEFVSANPTGPMHIGNARGGAIGDTLASVLDWSGFDVYREFYVNDYGNQIEKFFVSLDARYKQAILGESAIEFPEDGYHGDDIKERAKEFIEIYGDKFINNDGEEYKQTLISYALEKNISALRADLEKYRITYDRWFRESELYNSGEVEKALKKLGENGYTYEKDGALWLMSTKFGAEKDEVLTRANGLHTYFCADIAYHMNKFDRGFQKLINVWGADHHGHVARMQGALDAVSHDGKALYVVLMQLVRLVRDGEVVRVSKRSGKSISLADLLEETSIDAARFLFNMRRSDSHLDFDLGLAVEQSNQNPVYYVQYAFARITSILRLLADEGFTLPDIGEIDFSLLKDNAEIELISHLSTLPQEIIDAGVEYDPSKITRYAMDLAAIFHKFYAACRVNVEDEGVKSARAALLLATKTTLANTLQLLKITAPERM